MGTDEDQGRGRTLPHETIRERGRKRERRREREAEGGGGPEVKDQKPFSPLLPPPPPPPPPRESSFQTNSVSPRDRTRRPKAIKEINDLALSTPLSRSFHGICDISIK